MKQFDLTGKIALIVIRYILLNGTGQCLKMAMIIMIIKHFSALFTIFEKIIMGGKGIVPPPMLKEIIQFTPPVIKKKK
jgi:hypothetical protein